MFTTAVMSAVVAMSAYAEGENPNYTYDFVPEVLQEVFQEVYDNETGSYVGQVRIDVKFSEEVWWVERFSQQCYLLDSEGKKVENWTPDFSGPASDYSVFYFGVNGLNKYVDADYTLVIPQGLMGNTAWYYDTAGAKSNPDLKYDFNAWKLAGCPREDKTTYDFDPISNSVSLEEVRINGAKQLELQLALDFPEDVAISDNFKNKWSVYSNDEYLSNAVVRAWVNEENPCQVIVGLRGVDLKNSVDYTISIWSGSFGTLEWAKEDYCEGRSNSPLKFEVNPKTSGVDNITLSGTSDSVVYNLQGVRINPESLSKGIYIKDGKKFIVK